MRDENEELVVVKDIFSTIAHCSYRETASISQVQCRTGLNRSDLVYPFHVVAFDNESSLDSS